MDGFYDTVQSCWTVIPRHKMGSAPRLATKLKNLRHSLKQWRRNISNLRKLIDKCNKVILFFDSLGDCRPLYAIEWNFRGLIKDPLLQHMKFRNSKICTGRRDLQPIGSNLEMSVQNSFMPWQLFPIGET